jgi:PAS domain S-box-containing protein
MLNVLVVSEHEVCYLDISLCFYAENILINSVQVKNKQDLVNVSSAITFNIIIIDFPVQIAFDDIVGYCKNNHPDCLIYIIFENLNEMLISDFLHKGAYSFALKNNLQSLVYSIRTALHEKEQGLVFSHLNNQENLIHSVLDQAVDPFWIKNKEGKYIYINAAGARFVSKPINKIIGKYDHEIFPQETAQQIGKSDQAVLQTGKTQTIEQSLTNCQDVKRTFQAVKTIFRDNTGRTQGIIGTIRDITSLIPKGIPSGV